MTGFITGNAADEAIRKQDGWFVGYFIDVSDLRHSNDVEVKWGILRSGQMNEEGFVANKTAKSLCVMIAGHLRLYIRHVAKPEIVQTVELSQTGQYVLWDKSIQHNWEAISDCIVLAVRWPSVPGDQV